MSIELVTTDGVFELDGVEAAFEKMHSGGVLRSVVML